VLVALHQLLIWARGLMARYRLCMSVTAGSNPVVSIMSDDDIKVTNDIDGFMMIYFALTTEKEKDPLQYDK
jgi:hypothetical protein